MKAALKNAQKIESLSLDLLKASLSGEESDYWSIYDSLIGLFGYCRIIIQGKSMIIRQRQEHNYKIYEHQMKKSLSQVDELQRVQMRRFWQEQINNSDKFQSTENNLCNCILTPVNPCINMEIQKHHDFNFTPYAFVDGDHVVYVNSCAMRKGIIKGLPVMLAQRIDGETKFIQISKYAKGKLQQVCEILSERYNGIEMVSKGESIHFVLRIQQDDEHRELLEKQLRQIIEDVFSISGLRMIAVVSVNKLATQLIANSLQLPQLLQPNPTLILLTTISHTQSYLQTLQLTALPYLSVHHIRFLNSHKITTIKSLLQNLYVLEVIFGREQTMIVMESCLGKDHTQDKLYVEEKIKEFKEKGLDYEKYFDKCGDLGNKITNKYRVGQNKSLEEKEYLQKVHQQSDMESVKSERIHQINQKQQKSANQSKSEKNCSINKSIQNNQNNLRGFVKKTKKQQ